MSGKNGVFTWLGPVYIVENLVTTQQKFSNCKHEAILQRDLYVMCARVAEGYTLLLFAGLFARHSADTYTVFWHVMLSLSRVQQGSPAVADKPARRLRNVCTVCKSSGVVAV